MISVHELAGGAADAPLLDEGAGVVDPLLVVDLDAPTGDALDAAVAAAHRSDRLLIGVRSGAVDEADRDLREALDVTLAPEAGGVDVVAAPDPERTAADLAAAAGANPQAALLLARVLRDTSVLDVAAALDVESLAYSTLLGGAEFRAWLEGRGPRPVPPPAGAPPVLVERAGDDLHVTLNRPERRNAYGREMRDGLVDALRIAVLDPSIRRVTLDGAGPSFCSGGDLDEFGTTPDLTTAHFVRTRGGAGRLLHQLAARTLVRLHGSCVGAGIELPAFAGRVVADPGTTFRLPEVGMGLIPGAGGTVSIPRRIGRWRALYLALSGTALDAATAWRWGLVDDVTPVPEVP